MAGRLRIGRKGEKLARRLLKKSGYKILARNYTCPAGEIDLIALDGRTIAFVEVKARQGSRRADPENTVTLAKQRKLYQVAQFWLSQRRAEEYGCRFDVVAVTFPEKGDPVIRHTIDAFDPA